jgi:hypothetical protein
MGSRRQAGSVLVVVVCLAALVGVSPGAAQPSADHSRSIDAPQLGDGGIEPDGILLRVDLQTDGDASWTIEYRIRLNDENTTAAFESLQTDIEANESAYTATFEDRMQATARAAENATGREMAVRNVSVGATRQQLPQEYGVVTYRFEWTNFARVDGDTVRAGDALAGLFLDRQTTLVIGWPEGYGVTDVAPTPDERRDDAVSWVGPTDFGTGEPSVSLSAGATPPGGAEGSDGGTGGGDGDASGTTGGSTGGGLLPFVLVAVVAAVAVGGVVLFRRRQSAGTGRTDTTASADAPTRAGEEAETSTESASTGGREAGASDESAQTDTDGQEAPWDDELLSNAERVVALLEHNDGRMKQQAIASELEWSDAKTSQVIGKMREADDVETFRLGRENVVSLPGSREP